MCSQLTYTMTTESDLELGTIVVEIPYAGTTLSLPGHRTDDEVQSRFQVLDSLGIFGASDEDGEEGAEYIRAAHVWIGFSAGTAGDWFTVTFDHTGGAPPTVDCIVTELGNKDAVEVSTDLATCQLHGG